MSQFIKALVLTGIGLGFVSRPVVAQTNEAPTKYALLIGVTKYEHSDFNKPPLAYPEADATSVGELLGRSGYTVDYLRGKGATKKAIRDKLAAFAGKGATDGVVVIGLFGHGIDPEGTTGAYFCPYDTKKELFVPKDDMGRVIPPRDGDVQLREDPKSLIAMSEIIDAFKSSPANHRALIADCCRKEQNRTRTFGSNLKVGELPENTAVLFACSKGEQEIEHLDWGHGVFTKCLLEEMESLALDGRVTAGTLSDRIGQNVTSVLKKRGNQIQTPTKLENGIEIDLQLTLHPEKIQLASLHGDRNRIARKISEALRNSTRWNGQVSLGTFENMQSRFANAGPGLEQELLITLKGENVTIEKNADLAIDGNYSWSQSSFDLSIRISDQRVRSLKKFIFQADDPAAIISGAGGSAEFPTNRDLGAVEIKEAVQEAIQNPDACIEDNRVKPKEGSLYSVRIQARQETTGIGFTELTPFKEDGHAFVELKPGDEYEIIVTNSSPQEIAADITIDGLSVFDFSTLRKPKTDEPLYRYYIIPAGKSQTIRGWHLSDSDKELNYSRFLVQELPGGKPARGKVGVITVAFGLSRPDDKLGQATYQGAKFSERVDPVRRQVAAPHSILSVHYSR